LIDPIIKKLYGTTGGGDGEDDDEDEEFEQDL